MEDLIENLAFYSLTPPFYSVFFLLIVSLLEMFDSLLELFEYDYIPFLELASICALILVFISIDFRIRPNLSTPTRRLLTAGSVIYSIIIGILFISNGVLKIKASLFIANTFETEESCLSYFSNIESAYSRAEQVMCHAYCPCKATNNYIDLLHNINKTETLEFKVFSNRHTGASSIVSCDPCYEILLYNESGLSSNNSIRSSSLTSSEYYGLVNWFKDSFNLTVNSKSCNLSANSFKNLYFSSDELKYFPIISRIERKSNVRAYAQINEFICLVMWIVGSQNLSAERN